MANSLTYSTKIIWESVTAPEMIPTEELLPGYAFAAYFHCVGICSRFSVHVPNVLVASCATKDDIAHI